MQRFIGLIGIVVILLIAYVMSNNKKKINDVANEPNIKRLPHPFSAAVFSAYKKVKLVSV